MGTTGAMGMADAVNDGQLGLRQALSWHLSSNHYPPINPVFIPVAVRAIELGNDEEWDVEIVMPNGITKTAGEIVEELHLDAFLADDTDYELEAEIERQERDKEADRLNRLR